MSRYFELLDKVEKQSDLVKPLPRHSADTHPILWERARTINVEQPGQVKDWLRLWTVLQKRWRVSAVFAGSVLALVILFTLLMNPVYEPIARLEIDPPGDEMFSLDRSGAAANDAEYLETQSKNLQSDELAISVIRQLRLDQNQELMSSGVVTRALRPILSAAQRVPRLLRGGNQSNAESSATALRLTPAENEALTHLQSRLSVTRDTSSRLVNVGFESHDPVLSANVVNTLVNNFIEREFQTRHDAIMKSTQWLSRQLDDIRLKMEESNRNLASFQQATGIADLDQNRSTFTEQMGELSRQKTQAQAERIQIASYLNNSNHLETLPQIQNSLVIQQLTQKLADTRAELSNTRAVYGPNHPNSKRLQNQVDELQAQVNLQQNAIVSQLRTSHSAAVARENSLNAELRGSTKELNQIAQYSALKKEAEANAALYNSLFGRVKEAGITAASKSSNIRIVDQARVLSTPTTPKPLLNLGVGFLVALMGGVLLAFLREGFDKYIRTPEDFCKATGLPSMVSILPLAERAQPTLQYGSWPSRLLSARQPTVLHIGSTPRFVMDKPSSVQAEAMRGLQATIMLSNPETPPKTLLVASSLPGEGKTTIAVNLAIALAEEGSTCLVDADLRRPGIGAAFDLNGRSGLDSYLAGTADLESVLFNIPDVANLTVLPAGKANADLSKLISPDKVRSLLAMLRERFTFVIIDSPPLLPYADGRAIASFVDGVVLVGRAGFVTRDDVSRSMELLEAVHSAPVLQVVLNAAVMHAPDYQYYSRDQHA